MYLLEREKIKKFRHVVSAFICNLMYLISMILSTHAII